MRMVRQTDSHDKPVYGFGARKRPGVDVAEFEGGAIRITLTTKTHEVIAFIPSAESDARRDGYDFMLMVCSESCGRTMKSALKEEVQLGDALFDELDTMSN